MDATKWSELSEELKGKINEWVKSPWNEPEVYLDYQDNLSGKEVNLLLDENRRNDCLDSVNERYREVRWDAENYAIKECIEEFEDELESEMNGGSDWKEYAWDLLRYSGLFCADIDLDRLVRNTRPYITLRTNLEYWVQGWRIWSDLAYEDLQEILSALFINPRYVSRYFDLAKQWPNYLYRDGREAVDVDKFCESIYNCPYGGEIVALMDGQEGLRQAMKWDGESDIVVKKGSVLLIHDYMNGSGGLEFATVRDMKLKKKHIWQFESDDGNKYGVQSVHGMVDNVWCSEVAYG